MTNLVVIVGDLLASMSQQVKALNSLSTALTRFSSHIKFFA